MHFELTSPSRTTRMKDRYGNSRRTSRRGPPEHQGMSHYYYHGDINVRQSSGATEQILPTGTYPKIQYVPGGGDGSSPGDESDLHQEKDLMMPIEMDYREIEEWIDNLKEIEGIMDLQKMDIILPDEDHLEEEDCQDHQEEEDLLVHLDPQDLLDHLETQDHQDPLDHEDIESALDLRTYGTTGTPRTTC